jgi:hypothetical protein
VAFHISVNFAHGIPASTEFGEMDSASSVIAKRNISEWDTDHCYFFTMSLPANSGLRPLIQFRNHLFTDGRTPWMSDQPFARPLPKHRTTQTQNKRIHTPNIHALNGIRTHDPIVRASEGTSYLRPPGYCDRPIVALVT